jgi:hypothetical protein
MPFAPLGPDFTPPLSQTCSHRKELAMAKKAKKDEKKAPKKGK